jgi:hypothetical protein
VPSKRATGQHNATSPRRYLGGWRGLLGSGVLAYQKLLVRVPKTLTHEATPLPNGFRPRPRPACYIPASIGRC